MPFYRIPALPLFCNIWRIGGIFPRPADIATVKCQLQWKVGLPFGDMLLTLPKGTDIRDVAVSPGAGPDYVECPAASGRFYAVVQADDIAKGFPNEHRFALLAKTTNPNLGGAQWPAPMP